MNLALDDTELFFFECVQLLAQLPRAWFPPFLKTAYPNVNSLQLMSDGGMDIGDAGVPIFWQLFDLGKTRIQRYGTDMVVDQYGMPLCEETIPQRFSRMLNKNFPSFKVSCTAPKYRAKNWLSLNMQPKKQFAELCKQIYPVTLVAETFTLSLEPFGTLYVYLTDVIKIVLRFSHKNFPQTSSEKEVLGKTCVFPQTSSEEVYLFGCTSQTQLEFTWVDRGEYGWLTVSQPAMGTQIWKVFPERCEKVFTLSSFGRYFIFSPTEAVLCQSMPMKTTIFHCANLFSLPAVTSPTFTVLLQGEPHFVGWQNDKLLLLFKLSIDNYGLDIQFEK